jgi:phosphoserine phosphatase RsbU/P
MKIAVRTERDASRNFAMQNIPEIQCSTESPGKNSAIRRPDRVCELLAHNELLEKRNRELVAAYTTLDDEFRTVGLIQQSLLPRSTPMIPKLTIATDYRPCGRAGGDYYDFFKLRNDLWGILLADVSGHGTPAAVIMAVTHALAHAYRSVAHIPAALLTHLDRALARRYSFDGSFVTAFYGVFDASTRRMTYASAGHPSPRLLRGDGSASIDISALASDGGLPLGAFDVFERNGYESVTIALMPGDAMILYTDGISEARNQRGEFFGPEGIDRVLRSVPRGHPTELIGNLNASIMAFTADASPDAVSSPWGATKPSWPFGGKRRP